MTVAPVLEMELAAVVVTVGALAVVKERIVPTDVPTGLDARAQK